MRIDTILKSKQNYDYYRNNLCPIRLCTENITIRKMHIKLREDYIPFVYVASELKYGEGTFAENYVKTTPNTKENTSKLLNNIVYNAIKIKYRLPEINLQGMYSIIPQKTLCSNFYKYDFGVFTGRTTNKQSVFSGNLCIGKYFSLRQNYAAIRSDTLMSLTSTTINNLINPYITLVIESSYIMDFYIKLLMGQEINPNRLKFFVTKEILTPVFPLRTVKSFFKNEIIPFAKALNVEIVYKEDMFNSIYSIPNNINDNPNEILKSLDDMFKSISPMDVDFVVAH